MRSLIGRRLVAMVGVAAFVSMPLMAQEPEGARPAAAAPQKKKAVYDPTRRVPPYFAQIGLSPEQREQLYKIRAKHQTRLDELRKEIATINDTILSESEAVLSQTQRDLLHQRREAAEVARKSRQAKPAEAASESTAAKPTAKESR